MQIRHLARQRALQMLYAKEFAGAGEPLEEVERKFLGADQTHRRGWGPFAKSLVRLTDARRLELDAAIEPLLKNWKLGRLPAVERVCMRLALCELAHFPDIPLRVTINEYIELARSFGNDDSTQYINAVLDRLAKAYPQKDFRAGEEGPASAEQIDPAEEAQAAEAGEDHPEPEAEEEPVRVDEHAAIIGPREGNYGDAGPAPSMM